MRPRLLSPGSDLDWTAPLPAQAEDLVRDLRLEPVLEAMAGRDATQLQVCRAVLLRGTTDPEVIRYRQAAVGDALDQASTVRHLHRLAVHTVAGEQHVFHSIFRRHPVAILQQAVESLQLFAGSFRQLRRAADGEGRDFRSPAFSHFFAMVREELDDAYLAEIDDHLEMLRFRRGVVLGAGLGPGARLVDETLLHPPSAAATWRQRLRLGDSEGYSFEIDPRDETGTQALTRLRERGLDLVAGAVAEATEQVLAFFIALRDELGFYVGALNLGERMAASSSPRCFGEVAAEPASLAFTDLRDLPLLLQAGGAVAGNDLDADGRPLVVITGANQGGKSTFLRSLGVAQLLFQAGLPVPATWFRASPVTGVFTHYPREEDAGMERGRLDEELRRMSDVVDRVRPHGLVLANESFASTNEREGSEIAWQVVRGLVDGGVRVVLVTHLFELASRLAADGGECTRFLRAPRQETATQSFRLEEGAPLPTAYAEDRYRRVFAAEGPDPG